MTAEQPSVRLEPCPWCQATEPFTVGVWITCRTCGAEGPKSLTVAGAVEKWNSRPAAPYQGVAVEKLRELRDAALTLTPDKGLLFKGEEGGYAHGYGDAMTAVAAQIDALLSQSTAALGDGWRPINEHNGDNVPVLLWTGDRQVVASWTGHAWDDGISLEDVGICYPLWQPLPPSPHTPDEGIGM